MNKSINSITNKSVLRITQLICTIRIMLTITVMLIICVQPCGAAKAGSTAHSHKFKLKSVNCCTGVRTMVCNCGKAKKCHVKKGHNYKKVRDGFYTAEKCSACGKTIKRYLSRDIPSYWDNNIVNALKDASTHGNLPGYVYVTDPHWRKNAGHSPAIVNYVTQQLSYSYAVCGGDVVTGSYENKLDAEKEISDFYSKCNVPILSVQGNHDDNSNCNSNKSSHLNESDIRRLIQSHNPPGTHMSHGGDFAYIDDTLHRVRYITFYFDETAAVSLDIIDSIDQRVTELDGRWSVVLFSHAYWHYARPGGSISPNPEGKRLADALLDIQSRSKANIVLWHVGHIHRDRNELLSDGHGNYILVVATNCDAYQRSTCWGGLSMIKGTASEQVVEIVQIDTDCGKIYMTRIGAGRSRIFSIRADIS